MRSSLEGLLLINKQLYERILPPRVEWSIDDDACEVMEEELRDLAFLILKRAREFALFRLSKEAEEKEETKKKKATVPLISITREDICNAWDLVQMERKK